MARLVEQGGEGSDGSRRKSARLEWPAVFTVPPRAIVLVVGAWVLVAWIIFLAADIFRVINLSESYPAWSLLFNDRPVEWTQWLLQGAAILTAGFVAGRIENPSYRGVRTFLVLLGAGLVLMLFEDAGDVRHVISGGLHALGVFGDTLGGLPYRVVSDIPYLLAISALPLLALVLHGRDAWRATSARGYLVSAYLLYAIAGGGSGLRHIGDLYITIGAAIDRIVFAGRFPVPEGMIQERAHFYILDSLIEESIETMAAAAFLAAILAIGREVRRRAM